MAPLPGVRGPPDLGVGGLQGVRGRPLQGLQVQVLPPPLGRLTALARYQETYDVVRQVVDENGGEVRASTASLSPSLQIQYVDVAEFLVRQMEGKFHTTDLRLMQVHHQSILLLAPIVKKEDVVPATVGCANKAMLTWKC